MLFRSLTINTPKIFPARFARRIASFSFVFIAFDHKYPKIFPGALRAPDRFIFLCFYCFLTINTQKKSRRASRAGLLRVSLFSLLFNHQYPKNFPGALRAPDCFIFLCFIAFDHKCPKKLPGALRAPDLLHFPLFHCF